MEVQTINIVMGIGSIICFGMGGLLCWKEKEGWGWFLFVGLLLAGSAVSGKSPF